MEGQLIGSLMQAGLGMAEGISQGMNPNLGGYGMGGNYGGGNYGGGNYGGGNYGSGFDRPWRSWKTSWSRRLWW